MISVSALGRRLGARVGAVGLSITASVTVLACRNSDPHPTDVPPSPVASVTDQVMYGGSPLLALEWRQYAGSTSGRPLTTKLTIVNISSFQVDTAQLGLGVVNINHSHSQEYFRLLSLGHLAPNDSTQAFLLNATSTLPIGNSAFASLQEYLYTVSGPSLPVQNPFGGHYVGTYTQIGANGQGLGTGAMTCDIDAQGSLHCDLPSAPDAMSFLAGAVTSNGALSGTAFRWDGIAVATLTQFNGAPFFRSGSHVTGEAGITSNFAPFAYNRLLLDITAQ